MLFRSLQVSGADHERVTTMFPAQTVINIHEYSKGFPRLINTICENALITAYARQASVITPEIVEEVAKEFRLGIVPTVGDEASLDRDADGESGNSLLFDLARSSEKPIAVDPRRARR